MKEIIKETVIRFGEFSLANIPGTLVDLGVCWVLSTWVFHDHLGRYVVSPVVSFLCGALTCFVVFYCFVWHDRIDQGPQVSLWKRLLLYLASVSTTFLLRIGIIQLVVLIYPFPAVLCNAFSMLFSGLLNFILDDKLVFKSERTRQ